MTLDASAKSRYDDGYGRTFEEERPLARSGRRCRFADSKGASAEASALVRQAGRDTPD